MNILDSLSPERFAEEFPFLIENLALEFPLIRVTIAAENLEMITSDLRTGLRARPVEEHDELLPNLDLMAERARQGKPLQLELGREAAILFAGDLERGMRIRTSSGAGEKRTPAN